MSDEKIEAINTPQGRLINHSLFVKDVYTNAQGKKGEPFYKIEMAFDPDDVMFEADADDPPSLEDYALQVLEDEFGPDAIEGYDGDLSRKADIKLGFIDGDTLASNREAAGKQGDAYKGKIVIRAKTKYNRDGVDGDGGIQVFDEAVSEVLPTNAGVVFRGSYGIALIKPKPYQNDDGDHCVTWYLMAYQKTGGKDEDKLTGNADHSTLFKKVGRAPAKEGGRRSRRRG